MLVTIFNFFNHSKLQTPYFLFTDLRLRTKDLCSKEVPEVERLRGQLTHPQIDKMYYTSKFFL